ncbi:MAG: hypothetical protein J6C33_10715, partial [Lachnospiraceae bacterium]|nr:hypothetical protein [Lachnospiraceae bacterium]
ITGIGVIFFIMFLGCLISMLVKPVLVQRYLFLGLGVLWLGTALGISQWKNKKVQAGIAIFALIIGILNFQAFIRVENEGRDGCRKLWQTLEEVEEGDVILSNFGQVRLTLAYLMPETKVCYYWRQHTEDLFKNMYGNLVDTRDEDEILSYLTTENKMYYFDVLEMEEFHFQNDCTYENITFKEIGKYLVEDVWVQVYEVTRR